MVYKGKIYTYIFLYSACLALKFDAHVDTFWKKIGVLNYLFGLNSALMILFLGEPEALKYADFYTDQFQSVPFRRDRLGG